MGVRGIGIFGKTYIILKCSDGCIGLEVDHSLRGIGQPPGRNKPGKILAGYGGLAGIGSDTGTVWRRGITPACPGKEPGHGFQFPVGGGDLKGAAGFFIKGALLCHAFKQGFSVEEQLHADIKGVGV